MRDVQDCYQRPRVPLFLLCSLIPTLTLAPPPNNALLANLDMYRDHSLQISYFQRANVDREAVVQLTFHLERSSSCVLSALMVRTQCNASLPVFSTQLYNTDLDSCPLEVKPRPMKPSIISFQKETSFVHTCIVYINRFR